MAQVDNDTASTAGNTAVPEASGDRDRVAMLSLRADGTPDQHRPEIIGDKEFALAATREQFRQQAVSAVDQAERKSGPLGSDAETVGQDPAIAELQGKHQAAEVAAERAADRAVNALYDGDPETNPAAVEGKAGQPAEAKRTTGKQQQ